MKVATNVKSKKKVSAKMVGGPGDDDKKKKNPPPTEKGKEQINSTKPGATMYSVDPRADAHSKAHTLKVAARATKRKPSPSDFAGNAAPRVGGAAQKSTTLYTGKGALPGAKKLPKASTKRTVVVKRRKA